MMNIAIFGGTGFIGKRVVKNLIENNYFVKVISRSFSKSDIKPSENIQYITADIAHLENHHNVFQDVDTIVYLITTTTPKSSFDDPLYDIETNLISFIKLLKLCKDYPIKRFIFASSGGTVYGLPKYNPIDEEHPTNPFVSYGIVKLAMEKYLLSYANLYGFKPTIMRISNPYGEGQKSQGSQGVIRSFINNICIDQPIEIWGDGLAKRDFLHVEDVANAFVKALEYKGDEVIFNISSGQETSINNIIEILRDVVHKDFIVNYNEARFFDVKINVLSAQKAEKKLHWKTSIDLQTGIKRMYDHYS
ncbi:NAD-dependent epimerase/dehydratase family protein [Bartonella sp. HY406]|uniref:NAD-dependent epimerase/dehydratase family protein n=1 Tax=Bartonella sp. HY406 TaxID=2979331 RepID=UPI0021C67E1A|nr:NAD-dependent epimerase/dehydratase family protein [Bartonella sp. HY406]UXN05126.1 NAD-dependent epimerase/dehydratase family protein [Bartonella sp. HY406]